MKTFSLNKIIAIFALLFLIGGGKTLAETTATLQASSTDPSQGRPEFAYTINNVNVLNGTTIDYGYWNVNLYSVVNSPANAASFAFYAVAGKSNTYYIYNYSAKKWVTYDLATSYDNTKGFLKLSDTKTEGCYFEITSCTNDTHSGYQMRPYASDGTIDEDRYLNFNGGNGANASITVGLWQDNGSQDKGACWILKEADLSVKANITNTSLAAGSIVNSLYTNYQGNGTQFVKETAIDWTNQKVVAEIDVSTCGTGTEDLFSIGEDAITWFANNIHMYKTTGGITAYLVGNPVGGGATAFGPVSFDGNILRVELSSEKGFVVNDRVIFSKEVINQYSEQYYSKQFFSLSTIKVGSGEGNNQESKAKYNYISVVTNDYQTATVTSSNTLDEVTVNSFNAQNDVDVQLKRSLTPTQWNTFCVPFTISADVIAEKFGAGTLVYTFGSMNGNVMNFAPSTTIEAGKPYIVKPANTVVNPTFTGVNIEASAPVKSGENGFFMQGTYGAKTDLLDDGTNLFLGEGNKFYKPAKGSTKMKGLRAFFIVPQGTNLAALRANIDGATTAIDEFATVVEQPTDNRIYNLQGQFVGTSFEGLHGVYVQNGKKVLVK
jgi:hypothetical protein